MATAQVLQAISEAEVVHTIKVKEVKTGRVGHSFITCQNGVLKAVNLSVDNDMLIADGRELFDMSQVEVLRFR